MDRNLLLVERYRSGDKSALDELVAENERLVWSIVNRLNYAEKEDLFQIGCIGLINAAKRFDFSKGVMFSTYAVSMIMGEIKKFLRDDGIIKVSRRLKELAIKVKRAVGEITLETGKEASAKDVALKLGVSECEVIECLESDKKPISINYKQQNNDFDLEDIIAYESSFEDNTVEKLSLIDATKILSDKEKYILIMRYFKNKTQSEIAGKLGVSQVQISRLEKKILENLKKEII